jgi:pimeloyl-ACP methyl ester carboxylesterase
MAHPPSDRNSMPGALEAPPAATQSQATRWLDRAGGRLAYSDVGRGPLVVCVPGIGDLREEYRFLAPALVQEGFRAVSLDLRGHGESSTGWADLSVEAIGNDILALIRHLEAERALVVGTSMAAGAAVWAATEEPGAISGLVLIGPFVRDIGSQTQMRLYRAFFRIALSRPWGLSVWMRYWASLFPSRKPPDFDAYASRLRANFAERERFAALHAMMLGPSRREIEARLPIVQAPSLVLMGTKDRDFKDPATEAALVAGRLRGDVHMLEGAGHYPQVEFPEQTSSLVLEFAHGSGRP